MASKSRSEPPDQECRDRIASELDRTMLVEAAAGTGKTTCLITRMVGLLREGKCRIETMAAVTFTRKAAAELRSRFQLAIERAATEASGEQGRRLAAARAHLERCFIGTIHSFCARLLRERPVEAGVAPGFVELDETLDAQLRRQAWREHVAALIATSDPILPELETLGLKITAATRHSNSVTTELDELGLEPAALGPAFLQLSEYLDVADWPASPAPLPDLKPCVRALRDYAAHMQSLPLPSDPGNDDLMVRYGLIVRMVRRCDLSQPAQLMGLLERFEGSLNIVQRNWPGQKEQALAEHDRWNQFLSQHAAPMLRAWREHRYEPVMRAIQPARDVYERLRRERNGLSFQDLLLLSVGLLRDQPEVRRYFRERFTHLLVDEFQDTDPIQAELMMLLTADDDCETDWRRCRPAPGSLFVVGDPKQSIYRFRRADILTYSKVRAIIERVGGAVVPLSANFRSEAPVVRWVNDCFNRVFPAAADAYNPANRPLDVGRDSGASSEASVERLLVPPQRYSVALAESEADLIARTIRRAIDEQWPVGRTDSERAHGHSDCAQPGDFLIVARGKPRLSIYARKLQQHGLPHAVTGGSVLNEVPELELLSTCLAAVARSDDPLALVATLRSELFGVADTALYDFRRLGGRFSYHSEIPAELPASHAAELRSAFEKLQSYAGWLRRMPAAAAIERIASDLGLIARACAAEQGDAHAGSLLKSIELLRSLDGQLTVGDCVEAIARLVGQDDTHDGIPVRPPAEAPVRVMNLHQCKGLEAPFVFLVDPSGEKEHDVGVHIDRSADQPRGYLSIYGPKRSQWGRRLVLAHPPGWDQLAEEEQRFLDAEANRLLYVAATRAGRKLVISQQEGKANKANPWRLFEEHLQTAPKFVDPGAMAPPPAAEIAIEPDQWRAEVDAIERRWRAIVQPTYAVQAIKESAIIGGAKPHGAESGGAEWGQVLHSLLEAAIKKPQADLRGLALSALENEGLPVSLLNDAVATVGRVTASSLWRRAQNSERCLAEVPLAMSIPASETPSGLATVRRGVIDLVFLEAAGWVLVDYKSERVEAHDIPALTDYYRPQIEAYAKAWERAVGQRVVEAGLFFTHTGRYVAT